MRFKISMTALLLGLPVSMAGMLTDQPVLMVLGWIGLALALACLIVEIWVAT